MARYNDFSPFAKWDAPRVSVWSIRSRRDWIKKQTGGDITRDGVRRHSPHGRDFYAYRGGDSSGRWSTDTRGIFAGAFHCDHLASGVRFVGVMSDILKGRAYDAIGFYNDNAECETVAGFVAQWPARDGTPRYFPGVFWSDACGLTIWPREVYDTAEEAARAAYQHAEYVAEEGREEDAKARAEDDIEEARYTIKEARAKLRALVADIRASGGNFRPAVCDAVRAKVDALREEARDALRIIEERRADYWSAVSRY